MFYCIQHVVSRLEMEHQVLVISRDGRCVCSRKASLQGVIGPKQALEMSFDGNEKEQILQQISTKLHF